MVHSAALRFLQKNSLIACIDIPLCFKLNNYNKHINFNQRYGRALTQLAGGSKETAKPGRK
jgi:hypothetical protein